MLRLPQGWGDCNREGAPIPYCSSLVIIVTRTSNAISMEGRRQHRLAAIQVGAGVPFCCAFSILAHESRRGTVRLKTGLDGAESRVSTQK